MGTFRVEVQAVGGHGCQREVKDGGKVTGCGSPRCPDCITREYVGKLKSAGVFFDPSPAGYARLTHWPDTPGSIVDDLLTGERIGSF